MTPEEEAAFIRRRRGRNWAVMAALLALVALVYLIAMARLTRG
jgi:hypothetical protein